MTSKRPLAMGVTAAISFLFASALFTVFASAATAATIWPTVTPNDGDTVGISNLVEAEAVDDTYPIVSATLTVNGVAPSPLFITGLPGFDVYISYDPAQNGDLTPGPNHAVATVTNLHGDESTMAWDFTVNTPPAITAFAPGNDALVTDTTSPTVSVTLSDSDDSTFTGQFTSGRAFTLDGGSVASTYEPSTKTYSFKRTYSPLVWHTIVFSVKDSAGNPATRTWRFMVDTSPDTIRPVLTDPKPSPGSTSSPRPTFSITVGDNRPGNVSVGFTLDGAAVHSTTVSLPTMNATQQVTWTPGSNLSTGTHTVSADATDAAGNIAVRQTWSFNVVDTLALSHTTTTDFAACAECHSNLLTTEHENRGFDCNTCHSPGAPGRVQDAISAKNTACSACHELGHESLHQDGLDTGGGCEECHEPNISSEHEADCARCHESTAPDVVAAIASGEARCDSCHAPDIHAPGFFRYRVDYYDWTTRPGPWGRGPALGDIGSNPANQGAHANYLATTAKCGMCHSVHRAYATAGGGGNKLLPTSDATCAGCHTGSTAVTAKIVTWTPYDVEWLPEVDPASALYPVGGAAWMAAWTANPKSVESSITNKAAAGGAANGGGPHNDSALDLIVDGAWNGTGETPEASFELGHRYGCFTRRCHATNPHGANSSKYKLFSAKLLFNNSANADQEGDGTYGGLDAIYDDMGATDAAVERFVSANSSVMSTTSGGDLLITREGTTVASALDANEVHAIVAGLTCGRPSNPLTGEDECHAEASYAIIDKRIHEQRNHATGMTAGSAYRTDNTGAEALGYGGNDNRDWKTGHVAGSFAATTGAGSYVPIAGCTGCHDQKDAANTVAGNYTFPHGQVAAGASNLSTDGVNTLPAKVSYDPTGPGIRSRIWMGLAGSAGTTLTALWAPSTAPTQQNATAMKAYDGNCLKCHRDGVGNGIGLTR